MAHLYFKAMQWKYLSLVFPWRLEGWWPGQADKRTDKQTFQQGSTTCRVAVAVAVWWSTEHQNSDLALWERAARDLFFRRSLGHCLHLHSPDLGWRVLHMQLEQTRSAQ
ncbi:uncharacterized protein LOC113563914 [Drosophila erecta]|uniref:uncharacterized protein LOC113563914 n=1 Tax=Drosophila erecta TaxID=7220 RepID=UPI000F05E202|nr:uncharacterized protein LOC113563914 [Drosophila erecta]